MKEMPVDDFYTKDRVELRKDGRLMNDLILFQVKTPDESKGEWDLYKQVKRVPAQEVYRPLDRASARC